MNERIQAIINAKGIKKTEFAQKLNVSQAYISQLCSGTKTPSDRTIADICREFNVSEAWLRTGEGEMFIPNPASELDALAVKYALSHDARILVEEFVNLKPEAQQIFVDFARKAAESFRADQDTAGAGKELPAPPTLERAEPDLAAKVAELEHQNQELAAKVAAIEEEDARMEVAEELSPGNPFSGTKTNKKTG